MDTSVPEIVLKYYRESTLLDPLDDIQSVLAQFLIQIDTVHISNIYTIWKIYADQSIEPCLDTICNAWLMMLDESYAPLLSPFALRWYTDRDLLHCHLSTLFTHLTPTQKTFLKYYGPEVYHRLCMFNTLDIPFSHDLPSVEQLDLVEEDQQDENESCI